MFDPKALMRLCGLEHIFIGSFPVDCYIDAFLIYVANYMQNYLAI